jgi:hypothetical protein
MPESPNFEQVAERIVPPSYVGFVAEQLRLVWNARGAADRAAINGEFMRVLNPDLPRAMAEADVVVELRAEEILKALDR